MPGSSSGRDERGAVRVAAIVLAAGRSTRMGVENKLLGDLGGKPMVRRVVEAALASKAQPVLVVTGHMADEVAAALRGTSAQSPTSEVGVPPARRDSDVTLVHNPDYATGLASSLKAGIRTVPEECAGALILLGDMPGIAAEHADRLVDAFVEAPDAIVVPVHEGGQGNPVLWPRRFFSKLLQLEGDAGARRLMAGLREHVQEVPMGTSAIFADVDTPAELTRFREKPAG